MGEEQQAQAAGLPKEPNEYLKQVQAQADKKESPPLDSLRVPRTKIDDVKDQLKKLDEILERIKTVNIEPTPDDADTKQRTEQLEQLQNWLEEVRPKGVS